MTLVRCTFVALLLLCSNAFASEIHVVCKNDGVDVQISSPKPAINLLPNSKLVHHVVFPDELNKDIDFEEGYPTEKFVMNLAVPENGELIAEFASMNLNQLGYFELPYKSNSSNSIILIQKEALSPVVSIERIGYMRGIMLARLTIQPFKYNPYSNELSVLSNSIVTVKFPENVAVKTLTVAPNEEALYASIENKEHISYFVNNGSKILNSAKLLDGKQWYEPEINYLKISTTKDGVAILNAEDIIGADATFAGKNTAFLHLIYKGTEYPISIKNDTDGILNDDDRIVFAGKRPVGDTTWFSPFSNYEAFYLYYDDPSTGARLSAFPSAGNPSTEIVEVEINRIEIKEKMYFQGYDDSAYGEPACLINPNTAPEEGWKWDWLSPYPNWSVSNPYKQQTFYHSFDLTPSEQEGSTLKIYSYLRSYAYSPNNKPDEHRVNLYWNEDSLQLIEIPKRELKITATELPCSNVISGQNLIKLNSVKQKTESGGELTVDDVLVEHFTIQGKVKPNAWHGTADFLVPAQNQACNLKIPGYSSSDVIIIDTLSQFIEYPTVTSGTNIRVSVKSKSQSYMSIAIDDTSFVAKENGVLVAVYSAGSGYSSKFFSNPGNEAIDYVKSQSNGAIVVFAMNFSTQVPSAFSNYITSLGSTQINNYQSGNVWIYACQIGTNSVRYEKMGSNQLITLNQFVPTNNGKSFESRTTLAANKDFRLISNDAKTIEHPLIEQVQKSNLRDTTNKADVIFVTHKNFRQGADSLASYHKKTEGWNVKVVEIEDIYKEFNYGNKSPHSIKSFLQYALSSWSAPKFTHVCLIGDACYDMRSKDSTTTNVDYIPVYGLPASDPWYSMLVGNDYIPDIAGLSRIPCNTNEELMGYISKVIEYDSLPPKPWMKNFFFVSGGKDDDERYEFATYTYGYVPYIIDPELCADTMSVAKNSPNVISESESVRIIQNINNGVMWLNFLGHGSQTLLDVDGWQVEKLNNQGKYGILTTLSCNSGDYAQYSVVCRNESYMMPAGKGFIVAMGSTGTGIVDKSLNVLGKMILGLSNSSTRIRRYSELLNYAKTTITDDHFRKIILKMEFNMLGDPLLKIKIAAKPEYYFIPNQVIARNENNSTLLTEGDSVFTISGTFYNNGIYQSKPVRVCAYRQFNGKIDSISKDFVNVCRYVDFSFTFPSKDKAGTHKITIKIDPYSEIDELDKSNNTFTTDLSVFTQSLMPLDPLAYWDMRATGPVFRLINPQQDYTNFDYELMVFKTQDSSSTPVIIADSGDIRIHEAYLEWSPELRLDNNKPYWLSARMMNHRTGLYSSRLWVPFFAKTGKIDTLTDYSLVGLEQLSNCNSKQMSFKMNSDSSVNIEISNYTKPYRVVSWNGTQTTRFVEVSFDNKLYISTPSEQTAPIGLNLAVFSGEDGSIITKKQFYTFNVDTNTVWATTFLRDSVKDGDYVLMGTCEEAFNQFYYMPDTSMGCIDSLTAILKRCYGSKVGKIPQLDASYALVARKGYGLIGEKLDTTDAAVSVSGDIPFYYFNGSIESPEIGPAKQWNSASLNISGIDANSAYQITISGRSADETIYHTIMQSDSSTSIALGSINADSTPYLKINVTLTRKNDGSKPVFSGFKVNCLPAAELAILPSMCHPLVDTLLRGDSATISISYANISPRSRADSAIFYLDIYSNNGYEKNIEFPATITASDQTTEETCTLSTASFDLKSNLYAYVNKDKKVNEIYSFNNQTNFNLNLYNDTTKPTVKLLVDGIEYSSNTYTINGRTLTGMIVPQQPTFTIQLYDNSRLEVSQSSISCRLNTDVLCQDGEQCSFSSYKGEIPLKASLEVLSDTLDYYENILRVYACDATNNKDTVVFRLLVVQNASVSNLKAYPNPFQNFTNIAFDFLDNHQGAKGDLMIYNITGQLVRRISKDLHVGKNEYYWDGTDDNGFGMPIGVYVYRLNIDNGFYVEPVYGKISITK